LRPIFIIIILIDYITGFEVEDSFFPINFNWDPEEKTILSNS
jgi:hypothetical protein